MKILFIGADGTLGRRISAHLNKHEIITAGRKSGKINVDITLMQSIENMYKTAGPVDMCICTAASGAMDNFQTLTSHELYENMKGKLFGQIQLVLTGQHYLNDNGSFILTSGIFGDRPSKGVTGGGIISGALHSFVLSAAIELTRGLKINAVSPGMAEDSAKEYGHLFPQLKPVPMTKIVGSYLTLINGRHTGEIIRVY